MNKLNKLVTNYPVELTPEEVENLSQTLSSVRTAREDDKTYTGEGFVNVNNTNNVISLTNEANEKLNQPIPTKVSDLTDSASYQTVSGMDEYLTKTSASENLAPLSITADIASLKNVSGDFSLYYNKNETSSKDELNIAFGSKQDNLTNEQLSAISSVSSIKGTILTGDSNIRATSAEYGNNIKWTLELTAQPTVTDTTLSGYHGIVATKDSTVSSQWNVGIEQAYKEQIEAVSSKLTQDVADTLYAPISVTEDVGTLKTASAGWNEVSAISSIESVLENKKDKQTELTFNGSATKTVKKVIQNANGELNVEFEDIDLPQEVPNVEIKSKDGSVNVTESTDSQTNTKTFDLSVNVDDKIPDPSTSNPLMDGTASAGSSIKYAREDHVHPSDTSKESVSNKTTVILGTSDIKYPTDKAVAEFVNSSVATNTANYISNNGEPFTSVEQLEAYTGTVTNNDYAFVTGTDSEGNTYYDRYKATVSGSTVTWALEYRLNNSSFTAAQWATINSGITSDKANYWDGKQDALTAGDNVTINENIISSNQVFIATYGTTTYKEVKDAYDAGKICLCKKGDTIAMMYANTLNNFRFFIANAISKTELSLQVSLDDVWETITNNVQSKLTFDTTPTDGSTNPVTSEGIRTMKPIAHRFDNENLSRLIIWGKANSKGYINDMVRKFGLKYGQITDLLFTNTVHKDNTTSVIIKILNDSDIPTASAKRLKASIFKDSSENSYFALWLDGSISQPGWAYYVDYYPDISEQDGTVSHFTVFNPSEYTLVRNLPITYTPLALPSPTSTTGTQVLKCINGVVQWVTE